MILKFTILVEIFIVFSKSQSALERQGKKKVLLDYYELCGIALEFHCPNK
jgi:hypothetical protein